MKYQKQICFCIPKKTTFEMKYFFILYVLFISAFTVKGQRTEDRQGSERIRAMKVGMITQELKLNENQAEKFWPIYNSFSDEKLAIHRSIRNLSNRNANQAASNDELLKKQEEILEFKQDELNLEKRYRDNFLKVISAQQYTKLLETERKFNQMLLEKLKERRDKD